MADTDLMRSGMQPLTGYPKAPTLAQRQRRKLVSVAPLTRARLAASAAASAAKGGAR